MLLKFLGLFRHYFNYLPLRRRDAKFCLIPYENLCSSEHKNFFACFAILRFKLNLITNKFIKIIIVVVMMNFMYMSKTYAQNDEMVNGNRKPKIWKKWRHKERFNSEPFNPYLKKKKSELPSAKMAKQNKKELRRQKRLAKKQMRKNKKAYQSN